MNKLKVNKTMVSFYQNGKRREGILRHVGYDYVQVRVDGELVNIKKETGEVFKK